MKKYKVYLTHYENMEVEAENESEALTKAYKMAETDCFWDEAEVEEQYEPDFD